MRRGAAAREELRAFCRDVLIAAVEYRLTRAAPAGVACAPGVRELMHDALNVSICVELESELEELAR